MATFLPDSDVPAELNGVAVGPWADAPRTAEARAAVAGQRPAPAEPPLPAGGGMQLAAGVVIEDPEGRVYVVAPTNRFGGGYGYGYGYDAAMPKGRLACSPAIAT